MSSLPTIPSPSRGWMFRFELLHGHRTSIPILFSQLGFLRAIRAVLGVARRQALGPDPLAALGPDDPADVEDWLARRQLRPLLWLDSALTEDLGVSNEERLSVLGALVGATGAAFLGQLFPAIDVVSWKAASNEARETLVRRTMSRFGNIADAEVRPSDTGVRFDVRKCRFHRMVNQVERPELGPLFCAADYVYFSRENSMYQFERSTTRASGGAVCDFQLTWKDADRDG